MEMFTGRLTVMVIGTFVLAGGGMVWVLNNWSPFLRAK